MHVERACTMPYCSLCSLCGSNYGRRSIAYQLIIRLSWCEASNNVDSFLLYSQAVRSAQVGNGGFFFCGRGAENWSGADNRHEMGFRRRRWFKWEQKGRLREDNIFYYKYSVYMCNIKLVTTCICENKTANVYKILQLRKFSSWKCWVHMVDK